MSLIPVVSLVNPSVLAAAENAGSVNPFIPAGIAFVVFLALGIVAWSYRDVANRQPPTASTSHDAGH
jgi:heme/copper-type cytochrome/quinol oxidase subunit 2